jgi:hypothetical protein
MKFINLTPHTCNVAPAKNFIGLERQGTILVATDRVESQRCWSIESTGVARVAVDSIDAEPINLGHKDERDEWITIPIKKTIYGVIEGIPSKVNPDDLLIVSLVLQSAAKAQGHPLADQMIVPMDVVREKGNTSNVLGCHGFSH